MDLQFEHRWVEMGLEHDKATWIMTPPPLACLHLRHISGREKKGACMLFLNKGGGKPHLEAGLWLEY